MLHLCEKPHFGCSCLMFLVWGFQLLGLNHGFGVNSGFHLNRSLTYIWPLPYELTSGNETLTVNPALSLSIIGRGGNFKILREGFRRYKKIIFSFTYGVPVSKNSRRIRSIFDISELRIIVNSDSDELKLGVDESYTLFIQKGEGKSIAWETTIELCMHSIDVHWLIDCDPPMTGIMFANACVTMADIHVSLPSFWQASTIYGALRALETFSQLCAFDYTSKSVQIFRAPWYIKDKPRFAYRGLLLDTSRHHFPVDVIKSIMESMSYAKLMARRFLSRYLLIQNCGMVLTQNGSDILLRMCVKLLGIHVMAEVDVPGHAESWGAGYPDLWPHTSCREPLDVTKNFTFELISGILSEIRNIFPFELFHLGGDEVNTDCWNKTPHVKQWLDDKKMEPKDAYKYFVLKAQEIAISKSWTPVNWEETFNAFAKSLNPRTVVHNWLGPGVCPKAVAKGFKCIFSNQRVWYLDHLDVSWEEVYHAEPLEGISNESKKELVIGGEVCMWGETVDTSNVQQTIWPRAAAAAGAGFKRLRSRIIMLDKIQVVRDHAIGNNFYLLTCEPSTSYYAISVRCCDHQLIPAAARTFPEKSNRNCCKAANKESLLKPKSSPSQATGDAPLLLPNIQSSTREGLYRCSSSRIGYTYDSDCGLYYTSDSKANCLSCFRVMNHPAIFVSPVKKVRTSSSSNTANEISYLRDVVTYKVTDDLTVTRRR
ncbi:Beta-hexosaminidase 1 [Hibiscus syriacus]|uniref:beta-N-acetylhexosaminidase n=1 Tax=Hibiscus syriacus TaxID=106335 RepID=A0A6A2YW89_HIBSY|nr:Beta-hexosaminidase 1 [Hibiscus syriacus]